MLKQVLSTLVLLLALALCSMAQAPDYPNVVPPWTKSSGTIVRGDGTPATGSVGAIFSLYNGQTGGSPLWQETQNLVLDTQGRYSVNLGAQTPMGLPNDIFASGDARWLGVQPLIDGEPEQPRSMLMTVPYAHKSGDAETLDGMPATAFIQSDAAGAVTNTQLANNSITINAGTGLTGGGVVALGGSITLHNTGTGMGSRSATADSLTKFVDGNTVTNSALSEGSNFVNSAKTLRAPAGIAGGSGNVGVDADFFGFNTVFNYKHHLVNPTGDSDFTAMQAHTLLIESNVDRPNGDYLGLGAQALVPSGQTFSFDFLQGGMVQAIAHGSGDSNGVYGFSATGQAFGGTHYSIAGMGASGVVSGDANVVTTVAGLEAIAQLNNGSATIPIAIAVHANSTYLSGPGKITENYGVLIEDQIVGVNNYALKTGLGLVQFGDRTVLAPAMATGSSLNIPAGAAPSSPVAGDIWNNGTSLQFFDGSSTQTLNGKGNTPGSVSNSMLQNNSMTINAGAGLSGGGSVSLGGSVTLNSNAVTSVALSAPAEFIVSNSPVTASGTLAIAKANQNANLVYAGPVFGGAGAPGFRPLTSADMPNTALQNGGVFVTTLTVSPLALSQGTVADRILPVAGVDTSMVVVVSPAGFLANGWEKFTWQAYVPSPGKVAIHISNPTRFTVVAAAQTFNIRVIQ